MDSQNLENRIAEYKRDREYDRTPLMWAVRWNDLETIEWLLSQMSSAQMRAELLRQDSWGRTSLHIACMSKPNLATVKILLAAGADPNSQDSNDDTVLIQAIQTADPNLVRLLLQNGANVQDENGRDAIEMARDNGLIAITALLESARER